MSFLALILGVLLLQLWSPEVPVHRDGWFYNLRGWLSRYLASPLWLTVAALLIPALLLDWGLEIVRPLLFGLAWIALAAAALLYSFGRVNYPGLVADYRRHCLQGDFEAAYLTVSAGLAGAWEAGAPGSTREFQNRAQSALLYEGFQRWFPALLYFLLLGPVGALLYRLAQLSHEDSGSESDRLLVAILDWLPSRLLALTFAVTGDFVRSREVLGRELFGDASAAEMLHRVGRAATALPGSVVTDAGTDAARESAELSELLSRSAVVWVVLVAVLVLLF